MTCRNQDALYALPAHDRRFALLHDGTILDFIPPRRLGGGVVSAAIAIVLAGGKLT